MEKFLAAVSSYGLADRTLSQLEIAPFVSTNAVAWLDWQLTRVHRALLRNDCIPLEARVGPWEEEKDEHAASYPTLSADSDARTQAQTARDDRSEMQRGGMDAGPCCTLWSLHGTGLRLRARFAAARCESTKI